MVGKEPVCRLDQATEPLPSLLPHPLSPPLSMPDLLWDLCCAQRTSQNPQWHSTSQVVQNCYMWDPWLLHVILPDAGCSVGSGLAGAGAMWQVFLDQWGVSIIFSLDPRAAGMRSTCGTHPRPCQQRVGQFMWINLDQGPAPEALWAVSLTLLVQRKKRNITIHEDLINSSQKCSCFLFFLSNTYLL